MSPPPTISVRKKHLKLERVKAPETAKKFKILLPKEDIRKLMGKLWGNSLMLGRKSNISSLNFLTLLLPILADTMGITFSTVSSFKQEMKKGKNYQGILVDLEIYLFL